MWEMAQQLKNRGLWVTSLMSVRWKIAGRVDRNDPKQPCDLQSSAYCAFTGFQGLRFVFAGGQVGTPMVSSYGTQCTVAGASFSSLY